MISTRCSYVYDEETGLYYLQSRYYNPEWGRFLNADALVATGQGMLGNNMFAYCGNNPANMVDANGCWPLKLPFDFLERWLNGDGSDVHYGEDSKLAKSLRYSFPVLFIIADAIKNYDETGTSISSGTIEFTPDQGGLSLYLSIQHCNYRVTVTKEIQTRKLLFFKYPEEHYIVQMEIWDTYDFDLKEWNGFGNIVNNIAALLHCFDVGNDYDWRVSLTYDFK